jgi:hypothetical protein
VSLALDGGLHSCCRTINIKFKTFEELRAWQSEQTEKFKLVQKKYYQNRYKSIEGKARESAKNAVKYAIKPGKLFKEVCFICGEEKSVAHHSSYAKDMRLVVTWSCTQHHNEIHNPVEV